MPKQTFAQAADALLDAARAIHADNLRLLERLGAADCNLGIEFDCTLNGAQERIFRFFEALAAFRYGHVPWRSVSFMEDSTNALVRALEGHFHLPSVHAVGQTFRNSKVWWCIDAPCPPLPQKAYVKHLVEAREAFYNALNALNCDLFRLSAPPAAPAPPTAAKPATKPATKADLHAAVKTILRGEDVNAAKPGPRLTPAKRRQIEAAEQYRATHRGCTLHNACLRSFVPAKGGYRNAKALYRVMLRAAKDAPDGKPSPL